MIGIVEYSVCVCVCVCSFTKTGQDIAHAYATQIITNRFLYLFCLKYSKSMGVQY